MAKQKQILVLESERLLAAGIYSLLASRSEFSVTSTTFSALACADQPERAELDVIILDQDLLVPNITAVMKLVERHPQSRLLVLGLGDNQLRVFDKLVVQVEQAADFFELLQSPPGQRRVNGRAEQEMGGE